MKRLAALLLVLFLSACEEPEPTFDAVATGVVTGHVDGDNVRVDGVNTRFIGVDTPETVDPNRDIGCYGPEAAAFTAGLLPKGTQVRLVSDVEPLDSRKRPLAYVYRVSDGLFINEELVKRGYAVPLYVAPNGKYRSHFESLARTAQNERVGLWGAC